MPGYTDSGVKQATFKEGHVSLPDPGAKMAYGSAFFDRERLGNLKGLAPGILRSPSELHEVIAREGRVAATMDGIVHCLLWRVGLDCNFLLALLITWRRLM